LKVTIVRSRPPGLRYFRAIGAADFGALLTCGIDFAAEAVLRPDAEFRRTQILMGGPDLRPDWAFRGRRVRLCGR
jgi:hypothetical protein